MHIVLAVATSLLVINVKNAFQETSVALRIFALLAVRMSQLFYVFYVHSTITSTCTVEASYSEI